MKRALEDYIIQDIKSKIVLLSGPRQAGKTTLAKALPFNAQYLNFDSAKDRKTILAQTWGRSSQLVIFDELHKLKNWKRFLKGIYDTEGVSPGILVTGSARLDIAKKMGDSLAGRHFSYTLHPLTLKELQDLDNLKENFNALLNLGGFPEPFFRKSTKFAERWRISHLDIILRQDLLDLEQVRSIRSLEILLDLLRTRVGSTVSIQSLAQDLEVDFKTVKRWLTILENLYIIFAVAPYERNVPRALKKLKKYYFFDNGQVDGDQGARFENLVACALKREIDFAKDTQGKKFNLHYLRDRNGAEIDFLISDNTKVKLLIETKWADDTPSKSFLTFRHLAPEKAYQVIAEDTKEREIGKGLFVVTAASWLHDLSL